MLLVPLLLMLCLDGCKGSNGGGGNDGTKQPTKAIVTLFSSVTGSVPEGAIITGYDVTLTLPEGTTVQSTVSSPQTDSGVITLSSGAAGSSFIGVYSAATSTLPGTVRILLANGTGISAGVFCTVKCDVAAGSNPSSSAFTVSDFSASGYDATAGSTVDLTTEMSLTETTVLY